MSIQKSVSLSGGRKFHLCVGNLLEEDVDCIVNAANGHLSHGGGVAAAIARAAGPQLEKEGDEYIKNHGPVPTGQAVATTAGKLPHQGVIHAVGPAQGCGDEERKLISAVASSLRIAHENGWESIAFPAISSGIFRVPLEVCARAYVQGVRKHLDEMGESNVKEIKFTLFEGPLVELLEKEMEQMDV
jgi:O-acetyl-ADP-ribose deacetylase (regulator of RNase III)